MNTQQRHSKLILGLVAIVGSAAISAHANTEKGLSVVVAQPAKIQEVLTLADQMGFDYVIRPKLSAAGQFEAGIVEIAVEDRLAYVALRRMLAN